MNKKLIIIVIILAVLILGFGVYYFFIQTDENVNVNSQNVNSNKVVDSRCLWQPEGCKSTANAGYYFQEDSEDCDYFSGGTGWCEDAPFQTQAECEDICVQPITANTNASLLAFTKTCNYDTDCELREGCMEIDCYHVDSEQVVYDCYDPNGEAPILSNYSCICAEKECTLVEQEDVNSNVNENTNIVVNQNISVDCLWGGEVATSSMVTANSNISVRGECCPGLTKIIYYDDPDPDCSQIVGYGRTICSNCGNGICEVWENKCNCQIDCLPEPECNDASDCCDDQKCWCRDGVCWN